MPGAWRSAVFHLDGVAGFQPIAQRHHAAVHPRAGEVLSNLRMDAVGEVYNGRALRKIQEVALGGKNEDLFSEEVVLDGQSEIPGGP